MYNDLFKLQAKIFKALGHSRRLEILYLLREAPLKVSDIYSMLDLPQANVSQHLSILKDAEIVSSEKNGKSVTYSITSNKFLVIADMLRSYLTSHPELDPGDVPTSFLDVVPLTHDPVCGMRVSPKTAGFKSQHNKHTYYFCASGCMKNFQEKPSKYLSKE